MSENSGDEEIKNYIFFCMYKMVEISAETYDKNCVYTKKENKKVDKKHSLWIRMIDIRKSLDVENIYDLVRKKISCRYESNNSTQQKIRKHKRFEYEWFKDDKYFYFHEDVITSITMHCKLSTPKSNEFRSNII